MEPSTLNRRDFLQVTSAAVLFSGSSLRAETPKYEAAIIGRTGGGDYGHGYDTIWNGLENVSVEAIADSDSKGLIAAAARSGAKRK